MKVRTGVMAGGSVGCCVAARRGALAAALDSMWRTSCPPLGSPLSSLWLSVGLGILVLVLGRWHALIGDVGNPARPVHEVRGGTGARR